MLANLLPTLKLFFNRRTTMWHYIGDNEYYFMKCPYCNFERKIHVNKLNNIIDVKET